VKRGRVPAAAAAFDNGGIELFAEIEDALDSRYKTFGTFSPVADVPIMQVPGASNPRSLSPAPPTAAYVGIRASL
jgi:hypothetical protein